MGDAIRLTKAYFDSRDFKYREVRNGTGLMVGMGGLDHKGRMDVVVVFDDDDSAVGVRAFDICSVSPDKVDKIYEVCSDLNARFRWVRFYVDSDNSITAADDAVIQLATVGEEVFELVARMTSIVDDAYPELMKALWT